MDKIIKEIEFDRKLDELIEEEQKELGIEIIDYEISDEFGNWIKENEYRFDLIKNETNKEKIKKMFEELVEEYLKSIKFFK